MAGALVVIAKATEGTGYTSPEFTAQHAEAGKHGTLFLAYHFLAQGNGAGQAAHAHAVAGGHPLMLDWEPSPRAGSFPKLADAVAFIDAYRKAGGKCWLMYLPRWYWADLGSPGLADFARRGMLLVSSHYGGYTDANWGDGWQPYGGMTPTVWQYSSATPFNRQQVDFNAYRGSYAGKQDAASVAACLADFRSLASTGKLPVLPSPPPSLSHYRHEVPAGNTRSLDALARSRNTTVGALAAFSYNWLSAENAAILRAYMAMDAALTRQHHPHPAMPAGMVYHTRHP